MLRVITVSQLRSHIVNYIFCIDCKLSSSKVCVYIVHSCTSFHVGNDVQEFKQIISYVTVTEKEELKSVLIAKTLAISLPGCSTKR